MALVCKYCKHVVVRTDRDFRNYGRVADVVSSDAALSPGDRGTFRGRSFSVEGRLVLQHPGGGTWEEYYVLFDGRQPGWISEAQGFWQVVTVAPVGAPPLGMLQPGMQLPLGQAMFVVGERNVGTFLSAEGELPFAATPGTTRTFVDLSAAGGGWGSIDYGDGTSAAVVFIGVQGSFAEFQLQKHGGERPVAAVQTQAITCKQCGAPLPVLSPGTERAACRHCNTITDVKLQQVVARQAQAREQPSIGLGARGVLPITDARGVTGQEWIVLAYVERSTGAEGTDDWFGWQEYLLYNVQHGYRWLVFDEGNFHFVTPIAPGDVDASRAPVFVRFRNLQYNRRNQQQARVDFVLGELYWKVEVGETVEASDFVHGNLVLSCERTAAEVNWSHGMLVPTALVTQAFGYQPKASAYGAASSRGSKAGGWVAILVILFILWLASALDDCTCGGTSGSTSSPGGIYTTSGGVRSGSSSGGFGGK